MSAFMQMLAARGQRRPGLATITQDYTSNTTITVPSGYTIMDILVVGGGNDSQPATATEATGGNGGGGAAWAIDVPVTSGQQFTVSIVGGSGSAEVTHVADVSKQLFAATGSKPFLASRDIGGAGGTASATAFGGEVNWASGTDGGNADGYAVGVNILSGEGGRASTLIPARFNVTSTGGARSAGDANAGVGLGAAPSGVGLTWNGSSHTAGAIATGSSPTVRVIFRTP